MGVILHAIRGDFPVFARNVLPECITLDTPPEIEPIMDAIHRYHKLSQADAGADTSPDVHSQTSRHMLVVAVAVSLCLVVLACLFAPGSIQ